MRLIDADALKEWIGCDGDNKYKSQIIHEIADRIDEQPTVVAKPTRHGKWLNGDMPTYGGYKCSVCRRRTVHYKANYCPNCGAKMDGCG